MVSDEDGRAEALARRLAGPLDTASTARARERVWAALHAPRPRPRRAWLAALAVGAAAVALLVGGGWLGTYRLEAGSGGIPILYRERVGATTIDTEAVHGSLSIEQLHLRDASTLRVVARVDLVVAADAVPATVDVRYRPAGSLVAGGLAHEPAVSDVRRELGGARYTVAAPFPPLARGDVRTYEVWVSVDTPKGRAESGVLTVEIHGAPEGQRARLVAPR